MTPPLITLEEHFFAAGTTRKTYDAYAEQFKHVAGLEEKIRDLGDVRLRDMDAGKIALQIISHGPIPGSPSVQEAVSANNQLADAVKQHSKRFVGFATLPMSSPEASAAELERVVKEYGFVGALIDCHVEGKYYEGPEYLPFWSTVSELDVPIYIHPTWASKDMEPRFTGNFSEGAAKSISASGWLWHSETALHVLRLFASGLFDRFPALKIVIGHFGEMIPFMLERICQLSTRWGDLKRDFMTVYRENIYITTSGVWSLSPLATILMNTPVEHIMYSVDYPLAKNEDGLRWVESLATSGMVTEEQLELITHGNAERLFKLKLDLK